MRKSLVFIWTVFLIVFSSSEIWSQSTDGKIPVGEYVCHAPMYGPAMIATVNAMGQIQWVPAVNYVPSVIGNIKIAENGKYSMPTAKWNGTYSLDGATGKVTVTGGLTRASQVLFTNTGWIFVQIDKLKNECYLDGKFPSQWQGNQTTKPVSPEISAKRKKLIYGNFLITSSDISTSFWGKVYNWNLVSDAQETLFDSGQTNRSLNGELINVDKNGRLVIADAQGRVIDDLTNKIRFPGRGMFVGLVNLTFVNPALSPKGDKIAISLVKVDQFGNNYGNVVEILDRKGNRLTELDGYAQTAWLPDGRLIVTGSYYGGDTRGKRGLYLTDTEFRTVTPIVRDLEAASHPDVSKDGKKIAFWCFENLWTVNIDGTNLKKLYTSKRMIKHPSWSPKGDAIVVLDNSYSSNRKFEFVIIDAETGDNFIVSEDNGNRPNADGKVIWY